MTTEDDWVDAMADSLVEQLAPFLPSGITISRQGSGASLFIWLAPPSGKPDSGFGFGSIATQRGHGRTRPEVVQGAVSTCLDHVQDYVVRETRTQWPAVPMPMPQAAIVGDRVEGWFGDTASRATYPSVSVGVPE